MMALAYEKWQAASEGGGPNPVFRALHAARLDSFLADSQDDGVMVIDAHGTIVDGNLALTRRTGYGRSEVLGRPMLDLVVPSQRRRLQAAIDDARAGDGVRAKVDGVKRSGELCELAITFIPLFDDDRTVVGALAITQNLSEASDAERDRQRDTALLELASRVAGVVGWTLDLASGDLGWSGELPELRARTPRTLDALSAMLGPADAARLARAVERCAREHRTLDITIALRPDRDGSADIDPAPDNDAVSERHIRLVGRVSVSRPDGTRVVSGAAHDVTAAVIEQRQRLAVEQLLSSTVNAMTDGFAVIDGEWRVSFVNDRMVDFVGRGRPAIIGQTLWDVMPEITGSDFEQAFRDAVAQSSTVQARGWSDERQVWLDVIVYPTGGGLAVHLRDITDELAREEALRRAERLESLGTFAGGIAHDLNNVLTPITLAAQMLGQSLSGTPDAETAEMIETAARRGASMVRQVLTFARGVESSTDRVDVAGLLNELERMVGETLTPGVALSIAPPPAGTTVIGDATQLLQVLANLVSNANDAITVPGCISVDARLEHSVEAPGPSLVIDVVDTGHGMTPEVIARLWEPFFTTKPAGKGTGLGLPMVAAIIRAHGGSIDVASDGRTGSRFTLTLPVADAPSTSAPVAVDDELSRGDGRTVLVVDDEPSIRQLVQQVLAANGYRVFTAASGDDARRQLADIGDIDLVLSDVTMPDGDGIDLVRWLMVTGASVPIVLMSGREDAGSVAHEVRARCSGFLVKPLTTTAVLTAVHSALTPASRGGRG